MDRKNALGRFAWGVLAYNLLVIAWGAFVRASGSGAGCGEHWPLCNGEVVPRSASLERVIEFSHRVTSGLDGILVLALFVWIFRTTPRGSLTRKAGAASLFFIVTEGALGAFLVKAGLVAMNASMKRAVSMALHLNNTFLLLAALTLTAVAASGQNTLRFRGRGLLATLLVLAFGSVLLVGTSGTIAALGDTLFPATSLAAAILDDLSPTAELLLRLRVFHPPIAIGSALLVLLVATVARHQRPTPRVALRSRALTALFVTQVGLGVLNVVLLAPIWMQLVHLLVADLIWIGLVLLATAALDEDERASTGPEPSAAPEANRSTV